MYNSRRKPVEDVPTELTVIWSCSDEKCNGWMRENFVFSAAPSCPQCKSDMVKSERMLAAVVNSSPTQSKT